MKKKLSEMSLEELWQLFPIFLTEHQDCWKEWYLEEESFLKKVLPPIERISHIGSTAVSSIWAKPIIDILVEIKKGSSLLGYKDAIVNNGYISMSQSEDRISFNKGYTEDGFAERVFHLHLRYAGDNHELYFRDYLMEHPREAKEYEELKLKLWKEYEHDRDGYTNAKAELVRKYTEEARRLYEGRY
ncbi:MAG: GrpB family protein [Lachnospiraceae bacterium]|nr:GrpB family protein [Lachnospiraceae bacterium]